LINAIIVMWHKLFLPIHNNTENIFSPIIHQK
jgi:hypothetical protein